MTCPRHTVREDALIDGSIQVQSPGSSRQSDVMLTPRGELSSTKAVTTRFILSSRSTPNQLALDVAIDFAGRDSLLARRVMMLQNSDLQRSGRSLCQSSGSPFSRSVS